MNFRIFKRRYLVGYFFKSKDGDTGNGQTTIIVSGVLPFGLYVDLDYAIKHVIKSNDYDNAVIISISRIDLV